MRRLCCLNQRRRCAFAVIRTGCRRRLFFPAVDELRCVQDGAICVVLPVSGALGTEENPATACRPLRAAMPRVASQAATVAEVAVS